RLVVLDAAIGDDHAAGDIHARPFHQAELDRVADTNIGEPGAARHRDTGDAGTKHLLHAACRLQRRELRPRRALAFALAFDRRIAIRDMAMGVDEAGHDPLAAGIDDFDVTPVFKLDVGRQRPDALDPVAFDDDRFVARSRLARAVDQIAIANDQR